MMNKNMRDSLELIGYINEVEMPYMMEKSIKAFCCPCFSEKTCLGAVPAIYIKNIRDKTGLTLDRIIRDYRGDAKQVFLFTMFGITDDGRCFISYEGHITSVPVETVFLFKKHK